MPESPPDPAVRVLRVALSGDLTASGANARLERFADPDPRIERVGTAGGSALAHALLHRARVAVADDSAPLVIAVGSAVRGALPTAARASVLSVSPLTAALSEGQIGGSFARSFARIADALVLSGATGARGGVLVVREDARVELHVDLDCADRTPRELARVLERRFGACAALGIGAAGAARVPFASLAALEDPPSFVGRDGLGAVMGRIGLAAIVVVARPVEAEPARADRDRELQRALSRSPRLRSRSEGGTLELASLHALGGGAATIASGLLDLAASSTGKKGCDGCPTPCGLVFERGHAHGTTRHLGRFGALRALSARLGLEADDARRLLERCDELVLDAKEAGAVLSLARGLEPTHFDLSRALSVLDDVVQRRGLGAILALGSRAAARVLGVPLDETGHRTLEHREAHLAVRLGAAVSVRGSDPMRTFPFLSVDASSRERIRSVMRGVPLPTGAEDPANPAGKGRIVWWHENLVLALDATGFCAFSAAGLLSDGVVTLDELARWIAPPAISLGERPGRALLSLGASIALLQRAVPAPRANEWASKHDPALDASGMRTEYRRARGLDGEDRVLASAWAELGTDRLLDVPFDNDVAVGPVPTRPGCDITTPGRVTFRGHGSLGRVLADEFVLERLLPARLDTCLADVAAQIPEAGPWLVRQGRLVPQAWCRGRRVEPSEFVKNGDQIELVVAVGGG